MRGLPVLYGINTKQIMGVIHNKVQNTTLSDSWQPPIVVIGCCRDICNDERGKKNRMSCNLAWQQSQIMYLEFIHHIIEFIKFCTILFILTCLNSNPIRCAINAIGELIYALRQVIRQLINAFRELSKLGCSLFKDVIKKSIYFTVNTTFYLLNISFKINLKQIYFLQLFCFKVWLAFIC